MKTKAITLKTAPKKPGTISRAKVRKAVAAAYAQPISARKSSSLRGLITPKISFVFN